MSRPTLFVIVLGPLLSLGGCATGLGPGTIRADRASYNQEIVDSANEQLLLNLVRLRYRDQPLFIEMQSIVSQRTLRGSLSAGLTIGVDGGDGEEGVAGAMVGFEDRPTVTYAPLQGESFARRILTPLTPETIILLSSSGWSIERLLLMCVSRLNGVDNAPSASGPTPEEAPEFEAFHELATTLRDLQSAGRLGLQVFRQPGEEVPRIEVILDLADGGGAVGTDRVRRLEEVLGLSPGKHRLRLTSALVPHGQDEIALNPRSLMGVFYFLSQAVEPPPEHVDAGLVTRTRDADGRPFDWGRVTGRLLRIHARASRPSRAAVAVRHRDWWFYIDDADLNSKTTFGLLSLLLSLQSGGDAGRAPLLTLPTG